MKRISLLILCLPLAQIASAQYGAYPVGNIVQNGKILDIESEYYVPLTAKESRIRGKVRTVSFRDFTYKNGKKILEHTGTNEYNRQGQLVKQVVSDIEWDRKLTGTYTWSDQRLLVYEVVETGSEHEHSKTVFRYDDNGHMVERITTDQPGSKITERITQEYSGDNMIMETRYGMNGKIASQTAFRYDDHNNQLAYEQSPGDSSGLIESRQYDENGYKTGGSIMEKDGRSMDKWTMKNDDKGNPVERTYYREDGSLYWMTKYRYDSLNNEIERITYDADGAVTGIYEHYAPSRSEYTYDTKENITKYAVYKVNLGGHWPRRNHHDPDQTYISKLKVGQSAPLEYYEMKYTYWE